MATWSQTSQDAEQSLDPKTLSLKMLTGFPVIGYAITQTQFYIRKKDGTPVGTIKCTIHDDTKSLIATSATQSLPTSSDFAYLTFTDFDASPAIAADYYVSIETSYDVGSAPPGNYLAAGWNTSAETGCETYIATPPDIATGQENNTTPTMSITYGSAPVVSSGTLLPPPYSVLTI